MLKYVFYCALISSVSSAAIDAKSKLLDVVGYLGFEAQFLKGVESTLTAAIEQGKLPPEAKPDLMREISTQAYKSYAIALLEKGLKEDEIEYLESYLKAPENRALYSELQKALATYSAEALKKRYQELAAQDRELWGRAESYYRSPVARKLSGLLEELKQVEKKNASDAIVEAFVALKKKRASQ